jgi:exopolysaccharide biosynthesis predicted pyruvyltransferase EpsI
MSGSLYRYYKWVITENQGDSMIQVAELVFFDQNKNVITYKIAM